MPWIIDKDHIADPQEEEGTYLNAVGLIGPRDISDDDEAALKAGAGVKFRLYDDDGELYYEGRSIDPGPEYSAPAHRPIEWEFEPLDDFGRPNAGAVDVRHLVDGVWTSI
jgi:hypothetical protein